MSPSAASFSDCASSWRSATPSPPLSESGNSGIWGSVGTDEGIVLDDDCYDEHPRKRKVRLFYFYSVDIRDAGCGRSEQRTYRNRRTVCVVSYTIPYHTIPTYARYVYFTPYEVYVRTSRRVASHCIGIGPSTWSRSVGP